MLARHMIDKCFISPYGGISERCELIKLVSYCHLLKYHPLYTIIEPWSWFSCDLLAVKIDGLVQDRRNSIAYVLELCLSCTNPSKYCHQFYLPAGPWPEHIDYLWWSGPALSHLRTRTRQHGGGELRPAVVNTRDGRGTGGARDGWAYAWHAPWWHGWTGTGEWVWGNTVQCRCNVINSGMRVFLILRDFRIF